MGLAVFSGRGAGDYAPDDELLTLINIILHLSSFISLALKIPAKPLFAQSIESGLDRMCIYVYESLGEGLPVVLD